MKCMFCPNEIDETRAIHAEDVYSQRTHSAALSQWRQVTAYVGNLQLLVGHVCPDENLKPGDIAITKVHAQ